MQYRYSHADYIGKGTFGTVYKAKVTQPGSYTGEDVVAVKVIQTAAADGQQSWKDALARLRRLTQLSNKYLVAYHKISIFTAPGGATVELAMDYLKGDLASFLKETMRNEDLLNRYTRRSIIKFTIHIARGLEFLHRNSIIHGDLKPENILVKVVGNDRERLLIGDLDDLVEMRGNATCSADISQIRGTTRYMSPEMLRKFTQTANEPPGRKTDIWSLGCIMLEMTERLHRIETKRLVKDKEIVESGSNISNQLYASLIIDGFVPLVGDEIEKNLARLIRQCLFPVSKDRIRADQLLQTFRQQDNKQVIVLFPYSRDGFTLKNVVLFDVLSGSFNIQDVPKLPSASVDFCAVLKWKKTEMVLVQRERIDKHRTVANYGFLFWNVVQRTWRNTMTTLRYKKLPPSCIITNAKKIYYLDERGNFEEIDGSNGSRQPLESAFNHMSFPDQVAVTKCGQYIFYATKIGLCQYDIVNKEWRMLPDFPKPRGGFAMAVVNEYVYVLGGFFALTDGNPGRQDFNETADCIRLSVHGHSSARAWKKIKPLSQPRFYHAACVVNDRIYVCGGRYANLEHAFVIESYDTKNNAGWFSGNLLENDIQLLSNFVAEIKEWYNHISAVTVSVDNETVIEFAG
ncbi:uncharacterized protein LOC129583070 isoform X2 [Paramacrobiotus metropolitanus]|uniref:uncharacterized protein LOC129583070 isoform X2 n=2 Tax=Paramacrobiotus metropolitanus TaxID=2943436 RepID=UPI002445DDEB|nr:uncharacterized protein LOC129583070 isoform X2 [Paramacrobiotus metropolitanus]